MEDPTNTPKFNPRNIILGLVILFLTAYVFISFFDKFDARHTTLQSVGIFFCVGFFTMGVMLIFSSITFKHRLIYLIAPVVVILGTIFIMNFVYLTGIQQILTEFPQLQAMKANAAAKLKESQSQIQLLTLENKDLKVQSLVRKARDDFFNGKDVNQVITDLEAASKELEGSQKSALITKLDTLISHLKGLEQNINQEFLDLENNL